MKKELKDCKVTLRCTQTQKNELIKQANNLNMPLTTYASDKLFNGKERNMYARRKLCTTLVKGNNKIDIALNTLFEIQSNEIAKEDVIQLLHALKKEIQL